MKTTADKILTEIRDFIRTTPKYRYLASNLTNVRVQLECWESECSGDTTQLDRYFTKLSGKFVLPPLNRYLK